MDIEVTDDQVTVRDSVDLYEFDREGNDNRSLSQSTGGDVPDAVVDELESMNFFVKDYPQTFTWKFRDLLKDFDEVLFDIPNGVIKEGSAEHEALYDLLCGEYGGLKVEVRVFDGGCEIVGVVDDLPKSRTGR